MNDLFPHIAERMSDIQPFHVMDLLARARQMESEGRSIVHLEIGEPDFPTALPIIEAGRRALEDQQTHYTPATGLPELKEKIAEYYKQRFRIEVPARRIIITPGASGALHLALGVLINPGDQVLMADPGYPCNRHFVRLLEGEARTIPVDSDTGYQLNTSLIEANWTPKTVAALLASPSNPTGTRIEKNAMQDIVQLHRQLGGRLIVDEIYQGLVYGVEDFSALEFSDQDFVINSFSKYFGMTGWRLGWMVVPDEYVEPVDRLAQNIFLAPPTVSQHAALEAFTEETQTICRQRRDEFEKRRDYLLPALRELGFEIPVNPQGAFYIYANCSKFTDDSFDFVHRLLDQAGVAVTPGIDFGSHRANQHVRFAYTRPVEVLEEGVKRIAEFVNHC